MRIRSIKPEFFTHDGLVDVERATALPVRLSFIGLWCCADREGRFRWQPKRLKAAIFPFDEMDFSLVLDALENAGFLIRYGESREFGYIPNFLKHQRINPKEAKSSLPAPENDAKSPKGSDPDSIRSESGAIPENEESHSGVNPDTAIATGNREGEGNRNTPIPPEGDLFENGSGRKQPRAESRTPTTEEAMRVGALLHRRPGTKWSEKEIKAFKKLHPIAPDDLAAVEAYYRDKWPPNSAEGDPKRNNLRHGLYALLNNWQVEVDRARIHQNQPAASKPIRF